MTKLDVYAQIQEQCTKEQIAEFLRSFKRLYSDVMIGQKKEEHVSNLREAVKAGWIPIEIVTAFLQAAEENGDQHFFLFRRNKRTPTIDLSGEAIAMKLLGESWATAVPRFRMPNAGFELSDFRIDSHGWTGKLYRRSEKRELIKNYAATEDGQQLEYFIYKIVPSTDVCVFRLDGKNLEIRVPRSTSRPKIKECLEAVWNELTKAGIQRDQFDPLDLEIARKRFINDEISRLAKIKELLDAGKSFDELKPPKIRINDMRFEDSNGGCVDFKPPNEGETFSAETQKAIQEVYGESPCLDIIAIWLPVQDVLDEELRTHFISHRDFQNEFVIGSKTSRNAVDYVTKNLFAACQ